MAAKIRLRALQITPVVRDGEEGFDLHDRAGIAPDIWMPRELGAVLALCDGKHDVDEIVEILQDQGHEIDAAWLETLIAELDELFLLDSARLRAREEEIAAAFKSQTVRRAAFAGRSYPSDESELREFLEEKMAQGSQNLPAPHYQSERVRGVVTPHIDFGRGGHVEAASYAPLLENVRATGKPFDTLVILGIAHSGVQYPFCATTQDFATPFGTAICNREFVENLREIIGPQLLREQMAHQNEHSVEFSAVFCQMFDELKSSEIVPILCGGFWESLQTRQSPEIAEPEVAQFIAALREVTEKHEKAGKKVGFIASVDGAHVGTQFGDETPLTPEKLAQIKSEDEVWMDAIEAGDKNALHAHFAKNGNVNNVDAHPALYTLMAAFPDLRGQKLNYDQAFHPRENIVVSFASLALFNA
jgi:hypothetical protein